MARGAPALWSGLVAVPFLAAGGWVVVDASSNPDAVMPAVVGYGLVGFGLFVVLVGGYIQQVSPSEPRLREDESLVDTRTPTQRVARVGLLSSVPFFVATAYFYYATQVDYVVPAATLVVAFSLFVNGLVDYWRNTLTTYYVTTDRVLSEYRFVSLRRREIPLETIRTIEERQSFIETLAKVGNVRVVSGGGRDMAISIRNVDGSAELADAIRDLR